MLSVEFLEQRILALRQAADNTQAHANQVRGALTEAEFMLKELQETPDTPDPQEPAEPEGHDPEEKSHD